MYTKIYWIHHFANGAKLGIMPRPRGNDWLEEEIIKLKKQHIGQWVSLLEQQEINELGLKKQPALCSKHDLDYINFPIVDRSVPEKGIKIDSLIDQLYQQIQNGRSVVIHCRMGIGRSSIIAGCVLLKRDSKQKKYSNRSLQQEGLRYPIQKLKFNG